MPDGRPRLWLLAILALATAQAEAQSLGPIRGFSLSVPTATGSSDLGEAGLAYLQQIRLMVTPAWGPLALETAYQHNFQLSQNLQSGLTGTIFVPTSTKWLPLQWTIVDDDHVFWNHSFDRLAMKGGGEDWSAGLGRQAISWGTTLFLTPADPFAPFDPSDPFRSYRAGVDAARVRFFPGPLSELDGVLRLADGDSGTLVTAAARGKTTWQEADVSAWAGMINDGWGIAAAATRSLAGFQLRGEVSLREDPTGGAAVRLAIGADNRFTLAGRDLYVIAEYQHDDFGASDAADLIRVFQSDPFRNGELQVLGRDELALQGSWQLHPLWALDLLGLINLRDGSGLVVPGAAYSIASEVDFRGGLYLSYGDGSVDLASGSLGSEYGIAPISGYLSASWYF